MKKDAPPKPVRRRRADAERNVEAIIDAGIRALGERPDASVEAIAASAGLSRQTVYAHFPTRDALISAVLDRLTDEVMAVLDAANLDEGPASAALVRLLDASWQVFERYPFLLHDPAVTQNPAEEDKRHEPVVDRLMRLIRRGQRAGEFDSNLAPTWLAAATVALGHAAAAEVIAGRMSSDDAAAAHRASTLRLLGVDDRPPHRSRRRRTDSSTAHEPRIHRRNSLRV